MSFVGTAAHSAAYTDDVLRDTPVAERNLLHRLRRVTRARRAGSVRATPRRVLPPLRPHPGDQTPPPGRQPQMRHRSPRAGCSAGHSGPASLTGNESHSQQASLLEHSREEVVTSCTPGISNARSYARVQHQQRPCLRGSVPSERVPSDPIARRIALTPEGGSVAPGFVVSVHRARRYRPILRDRSAPQEPTYRPEEPPTSRPHA